MKRSIWNLPGVFPDADKWWMKPPGRSPDSRALRRWPSHAHWQMRRSGREERLISLTVAGAVEASHLVPEHLAATQC